MNFYIFRWSWESALCYSNSREPDRNKSLNVWLRKLTNMWFFSPFVLVTWKFWVWPELDRSFSFNKLKWIILLIFLNQLLFLYILNFSESTSLPLLRYAMLYKLNCIFELFYYCDLLLKFVIRKLDWCEWYFFLQVCGLLTTTIPVLTDFVMKHALFC